MTTRRRVGGPSGRRRSGLALALAAFLAACGPAAPSPSSPDESVAPPVSASPVARVTPSPTPGPTPPPTAAPAPTADPSTSVPTARPTRTPRPSAQATEQPAPSSNLDPTYCPATLPEPDEVTPDGIALEGDDAFVAHVGRALDLLAGSDPESYDDVVTNVTRIRQVEDFSGMCYDTGTYRVGEETAYAPGHTEDAQAVWLAGTIVHDACHRARFVAGQKPSGKKAEVACLELQEVSLRRIAPHPFFADYVRELIDGADDPENQYWKEENRHW
jgi:hypothetical protein